MGGRARGEKRDTIGKNTIGDRKEWERGAGVSGVSNCKARWGGEGGREAGTEGKRKERERKGKGKGHGYRNVYVETRVGFEWER
jgi:hypothetical protein